MKEFFEKLIDTANAKIALMRENEQRKADDVANAKAEGQKQADAYYEKNRPMFEAAIAAMRDRGIAASCERRMAGALIAFDTRKTDESLKRLASSFEYSYFKGGLHVSEVTCGSAAIARTLAYDDLKDAFVAWLTAAMEARGSHPA
jgi:hypothetical protein